MEVEQAKAGISKKIRALSPEGHLINETEISVVGNTLEECYAKYLLVKNDD